MGVKYSTMNALLIGDSMNNQYVTYKLNQLSGLEYFKCNDMLDFNIKKSIEPVLVRDEMAQEVFQTVNAMNHPNLIRTDFFWEDDLFYVVRTYEDDFYAFAWRLQIQRYLETRRKHIEIEEDQIVYWLKQLLTAVQALHDQNILHKFIIPEALSFNRHQLKLFVPALSSRLSDSTYYVDEERTWYRCPEHDEHQAIGLKYDIWSAGWTLYNLCSLEDGRFVLDQVSKFDENEWTRPEIPRVYTRKIDRLFKKMTQFDPDLRPTAAELLEDPIFRPF